MPFDDAPSASEHEFSGEKVLDRAIVEREALSANLLSQYPAITNKVTELADRFPDFTPNLKDEEVWREAVSILIAHEEDSRLFEQEYRVSQEDDDFILNRIQERTADQSDKKEVDKGYEDDLILLTIRDEFADKHGQGTEAYFEVFHKLLNDPKALTAKFLIVANVRDDIEFDGTFSSAVAERIKLVNENIAALQAMAGASPEYADSVEKAGVDVTDRQAVQSFVVESGFMEDATVSETTKAKVAQKLGIARNATSMLATLENVKRNGGQFINADGKPVTFDTNNGIPVGRYTVYPDPTGNTEFIATSMVGGCKLRVPFNPTDSPAHLGRVMKAAMVTQAMANRDFQGSSRYVLGGDGLAAQGMTEIKLDEAQVARAEQLYGAFMGFGTVISTEFPSESELQSFEWRLQATHIDGDAKTNDNTGRGDLSWQRLGLLDESGQLNMDRVERIGAFMNAHSTSLPAFAELESTFGQKETPS